MLVTGGNRYRLSTLHSSAELFDGVSSFTARGSMSMAYAAHTATLLGSGSVLVAGCGASELFDGTSAFVTVGPMTTTRYGHAATLLSSGSVLVAAGNNSVDLSSADLFVLSASGNTCGIDGECGSCICNERCCSSECNSQRLRLSGGGLPSVRDGLLRRVCCDTACTGARIPVPGVLRCAEAIWHSGGHMWSRKIGHPNSDACPASAPSTRGTDGRQWRLPDLS